MASWWSVFVIYWGEAWGKKVDVEKSRILSALLPLLSPSSDGVKCCRSDDPAILKVPNFLEEATADGLAADGRAYRWPSSASAFVDSDNRHNLLPGCSYRREPEFTLSTAHYTVTYG